jgi:hypothetical protein
LGVAAIEVLVRYAVPVAIAVCLCFSQHLVRMQEL